MSRRVVFLDKDGTLIENVPYNVDPERVTLAPGAADALRALARGGYEFVVVSNQSGVARGYFEEADLLPVESRIRELVASHGVRLLGFYYCPHHPNGAVHRYRTSCDCRKPLPGLLLAAAHDLDIDLARSWLIGDILDDVEAGNLAGARTILLLNGGETEWILTPNRRPDQMVRTLPAAASHILGDSAACPSREVA